MTEPENRAANVIAARLTHHYQPNDEADYFARDVVAEMQRVGLRVVDVRGEAMTGNDVESVPITLQIGRHTQQVGLIPREALSRNLRSEMAKFLRDCADEIDRLEGES